ncbi:MAG: metallophosphoesterase [Candidatus Nitrosocaldus sp.]
MKIIITSDIHFGIPNKLDHSMWAAKVIRQYAATNGIDIVLILGDLFHDRTSLNIQVLVDVYDFLDDTDRNYGQEWMAFPGNHDMFLKNSWKINSIRPLGRVIKIIDDIKAISINGTRFWILPFVHYESAYMKVVDAISNKASDDDILLTHIGVAGAKLNECFMLKHWSIVDFTNTRFKRVYSGHFHCYQQVGSKTWYPGSPIPFRFDEGLVDHGFLVYDTERGEHDFVNIFTVGKELLPNDTPAPDYITCIDDHINNANVNGNYVRVCLSRDYTDNELNNIRQSLMDRGALAIKFMKAIQDENTHIQHTAQSKMGDGIKLFEKWVEYDKPDYLDSNKLKEINKTIIEEGFERLINAEDTDASTA